MSNNNKPRSEIVRETQEQQKAFTNPGSVASVDENPKSQGVTPNSDANNTQPGQQNTKNVHNDNNNEDEFEDVQIPTKEGMQQAAAIEAEDANNTVNIDENEQGGSPDVEAVLQSIEEQRKEMAVIDAYNAKVRKFIDGIFTAQIKTITQDVRDPKTKELLGTRFKYLPDDQNKTVYDYINENEDDELMKFIEDHLEIKLDPEDPQDGTYVDNQVTVAWKNANWSRKY